jgi:hypothetical protein
MAGKCEINKILTLAEAKECLGSTPAGTWTVVGKYVIPAIAENKLPPPDPLPAGVYATKNWWNNHTNSTNAVFVVPGNIPAYYWFEDCSSWCSSKLQFGSNSSIRFDDETIGGITTTGRPKLVPNQASISTFNTGSKGMWLYKYTF